MTTAKRTKRSLLQYAKDKRREGCPLCKLPSEVLGQLRDASNKKISVAVQLNWLRSELGVTITSEQVNAHRGGRHEEPV